MPTGTLPRLSGHGPAWRRVLLIGLAVLAVLLAGGTMREGLLNGLLYFPDTTLYATPGEAGLAYEDVEIRTRDGERLHAWWIPSASRPALGHVVHFHGNAGNISTRIDVARRLGAAGLDVLLLDYRGYGRSTGSPSEEGTYLDARAARAAVLARPDVEAARLLYYGESLGGAVALELALETPPRGLVLQSTFTSVRDMGRAVYPFLPSIVVPDAYPSRERIPALAAPLLVLHGEADEIVPFAHGRALFEAAPEPKRFKAFPGIGHNDMLASAGEAWAEAIADWVRSLPPGGQSFDVADSGA